MSHANTVPHSNARLILKSLLPRLASIIVLKCRTLLLAHASNDSDTRTGVYKASSTSLIALCVSYFHVLYSVRIATLLKQYLYGNHHTPPFLPRSCKTLMNPPGSTISVPPYVTLLPVLLAHSSKFPYSTYPAPPTMNTMLSVNAILRPLVIPLPPAPPGSPFCVCLGARGSKKRYSSVS